MYAQAGKSIAYQTIVECLPNCDQKLNHSLSKFEAIGSHQTLAIGRK